MSEPVDGNLPPPLPPRRSPSPTNNGPGPSTASPSGPPPPLPPRAAQPIPPPIVIPPVTAPVEQSNGIATTPRVDVIPATPPFNDSPVDPVLPRPTFQTGQEDEAAQAVQTAETFSPLTDTQAHTIQADHIESQPRFSQLPPPPLPPRNALDAARGDFHPPPPPVRFQAPAVEWLIFAALVGNLFVNRFPLSWVLVLLAAYWVWGYSRSGHKNTEEDKPEEREERVDPAHIAWVNHALYALFPLISTDLLTPFIDLLEDALVQQVPPIVTSVRLTSASLGSQPILLNSLRALTDEEWFEALAPPNKPKSPQQGIKSEKRTSHPSQWAKGHTRSTSSASKISRASLSRSVSASSNTSAIDPEEVNRETQKRRKRDRILRRISRRHKSSEKDFEDTGHAPRVGDRTEVQRPDGAVDAEGDMDDPDVGEFVNYQAGFEYQRPRATKKAAWGLHMLAYFGWGIKGVGKSEIPVYIDVLSVKGKINLRLLLSATPPFVRTATVSFPKLPEFDISATPLKRGTFNAMELPGMKSYVQASIAEVAGAFVRPESFTLDVDRLLLGREAALRTHTVGVLHVIIHSADDLPKTDTVGSCDPYVAISFTKFNKPVFSTRTIIDTRSPTWEEEAFILVSADAIESGERLRLRLCDSDRFSADDAMGVVEVDLADLVDQSSSPSPDVQLDRRNDILKADRPGMRVSGSLDWSVRFCPLWQMSEQHIADKVKDTQDERPGEPNEKDINLPWWLEWINKYMDVPNWELERQKRRKETLVWFTGDREREEMEAAAKPSDDLRSGVLQFHIHQCSDLEVESLEGTYSSNGDHRLSAASGKPALADIIDRTPAENPDPPSAYCEVYLNDRLVYRTRTKQVTPLPYFNAVSERFIRDWKMAKVVFVVRDERDREHDPILGLVSVRLKDALADRSHFTRWFPLVGGLGWGRIRISLLFKPIEIRLPPRVSGYEVATLEITALSATDMSKHTERSVSVIIQTESDRCTLESPGEQDDDGQGGTSGPSRSRVSLDLTPETPMTARSIDFDEATEVEWELIRPIRLAVEYRHSCSVVISFVTKSKVVKKKRAIGIAVVRLNDCPDGEPCERTVPIFATAEVKEAIQGFIAFARQRDAQQSVEATTTTTPSTPGSVLQRRNSGNGGPRLIGFINLAMTLHPGVSKAHRRLCKRDLRFAKVYETWESARETDRGWDKTSAGDMLRSTKDKVMRGDKKAEDDEDIDDESDTTEDEDDEIETGATDGVARKKSVTGTGKKSPAKVRGEAGLDDDDEDGLFSERKAHSHALHKRHKGIFQLKIARTGRFVKDKLEAKMYSANKERRRGADLEVEHEGQSSL